MLAQSLALPGGAQVVTMALAATGATFLALSAWVSIFNLFTSLLSLFGLGSSDDRFAVHEQLGLARHELHALLDKFCEDLLSSEQLQWADACPVDERTLTDLMGEIQDPALRLKLLRWCVALAEVDAQVHEGESIVLVAAIEHWGLHHEVFRSSSRN